MSLTGFVYARWAGIPPHERVRWLHAGPHRDDGETPPEYFARLLRVDPNVRDANLGIIDEEVMALYDLLTVQRGPSSVPPRR